MITMPLASESLIDPNCTSSPSKRIDPSYEPCGYTPDRTFMRVDLPAPFSPQIAWISPRRTASETFSSALTPGKVLVMERISRMLSSMDSVVLVLVVVRRRPAAGGRSAAAWCGAAAWGGGAEGSAGRARRRLAAGPGRWPDPKGYL